MKGICSDNNIFLSHYDIGLEMSIMSKLKEAAEQSLNEWVENLEQEMATATFPEKTPEQMKAEADAIWEKAGQ